MFHGCTKRKKNFNIIAENDKYTRENFTPSTLERLSKKIQGIENFSAPPRFSPNGFSNAFNGTVNDVLISQPS